VEGVAQQFTVKQLQRLDKFSLNVTQINGTDPTDVHELEELLKVQLKVQK